MAAGFCLVLSAAVVVLAGNLHGADDDSGVVRETAATETAVHSETEPPAGEVNRAAYSPPAVSPAVEIPVIAGSMPDTVTRKLREAFESAVVHLREVPQCSDLFARLGVDGERMLATTLYIPAHPLNENSVCRDRAAIFTKVGAAQTWVCRRFSALSKDRATVSLLHEALHHAGLTEYPLDPDGLRAREIDAMVARACGL